MSQYRYVLALDQGTTSSRAMLFDHAGAPCGIAQQPIQQFYPQPGWVEHDALEIWESQLAVARRVLVEARIGAADIAAIGIANQRETIVLWDRLTGLPLAPAIVWQDRRTAGDCDSLRADGHAKAIHSAPAWYWMPISQRRNCAGCSTTYPAHGHVPCVAS